MTATYTFRRGEPVAVGDMVISGDILAGHSMRARMKPAPVNGSMTMPGDEVAVTTPPFASVFVTAAGPVAAHYLHSLTAAQSLTLDDGAYLFDSSLLLDGIVLHTSEPVKIIIRNSASG